MAETLRRSASSTPVRLQKSTTTTTPEYKPGLTTPVRSYEPDASIALVGFRGTGMSSLAVMASTTLGFRLLDADQHFFHQTGLSRWAYRSKHGVVAYRQTELRQLRSILLENPKKAVIVCGPGSVEGTGQSLLSDYARAHPVIHILRDTEGIQKHLSVWDADTTSHFVRLSCPIHRSVSAFEFYNLDELALLGTSSVDVGKGTESPRTLALKQVEEDFSQLIHNITKRDGSEKIAGSRYGLGSLPPEARPYSYALSIRIPNLAERAGASLQDIDTSADVVELVFPFEEIYKTGASLDLLIANNISRQYYMVRRSIRLPIDLHIETSDLLAAQINSHDEAASSSWEVYFDALHHGLRLGPEYLSVDLGSAHSEQRVRQLVAAKGSTKIIGYYVDRSPGITGWSKPERRAMVARAEELGCDMVRLCQEAVVMGDNFAVQNFIHEIRASGQHRIPLIAYNTGPLGQMSHFLNTILTPTTHSVLRARAPECTTPSLLTIAEAQSALYASFALNPMKFGIYGVNVSQSLSPAMHNAAFQECGMPHTYQAYTHPSARGLESLVRDPSFGGMSITAPFKREIMPLVDSLSREARAIGAVNTVLPLRAAAAAAARGDPLRDSNRAGPVVALHGDNTDWIGIYACIRSNLSPINAVRAARTVGLVVGAGGMARAAAYAMVRLGIRRIFVHNRSPGNAEELAAQFHGRAFAESSGEEASGADGPGPSSSCSNAPVVTVIRSKDDPWPPDTNYPTVVVSSVPHSPYGKPMTDNTLPINWLASHTGGVVIEVRCFAKRINDPCYLGKVPSNHGS